jgi:hypothetical protein
LYGLFRRAKPQYRSPRVPWPWKAIREDFVLQGCSKTRLAKVNRIKA